MEPRLHANTTMLMEKQITAVALALSVAGLGYLKTQQMDRLTAQAVEDAAAAEQEALLAQEMADNAARLHFEVPHDNDASTNELNIVLDGSSSYDVNNDSLAFTWSQVEGNEVALTHSSDGTSSFRAAPGKYTFELTVTDAYGQTASEQAKLSIDPEPNEAPTVAISVRTEAPQAEGDMEDSED